MIQPVFLYNKSNPYGIAEDVKVFEDVLKKAFKEANIAFNKVRHSDPLEKPILCDIAFHFEIPVYSYFPWARKNVLIVNPEWWESGWDAYLHHTDLLIFKCEADRKYFVEQKNYTGNSITLPWTTPVTPDDFKRFPCSTEHTTGCLWFLGGSHNKRAAAEKILPLWKSSFPEIDVYTTTPLTLDTNTLSKNVTIHVQDVPEETRRSLQHLYPCHFIFSQAEALGMVALEAEAAGAYVIGNALPVYSELFPETSLSTGQGSTKVSPLSPSNLQPLKGGRMDTFEHITSEVLQNLFQDYYKTDLTVFRKQQKEKSIQRFKQFVSETKSFLQSFMGQEPKYNLRTLPPVLSDSECPPISIVTLMYNRRKFVDLAFHNLLLTDYPKDKIEWIVVEDSDKVEEQASDKIVKFGRECQPMSLTYIPLEKKTPIGEKRNIACKRAQNSIILMMDDDDHYPVQSFRYRVAWLLKHPSQPKCTVATTIACYDLLKGTSAVNTPPFTLGLKERISEATLTFYKSFWEEQQFPSANMAEGDGFLHGREKDVLELQPQQIIVAMSHGTNSSSRRIPPGPSGQPSCFWGFPKEFLIFLHRLAGVEIEEDTSKPNKPKK